MVVAVGVDACITVALETTYAYTNLHKFKILSIDQEKEPEKEPSNTAHFLSNFTESTAERIHASFSSFTLGHN